MFGNGWWFVLGAAWCLPVMFSLKKDSIVQSNQKTVLPWVDWDVLNLRTGEKHAINAPSALCAVMFASFAYGGKEDEVVYGKESIACGDFATLWKGIN